MRSSAGRSIRTGRRNRLSISRDSKQSSLSLPRACARLGELAVPRFDRLLVKPGHRKFTFQPTPKPKQQLCVSRSFGAATDKLQDLRAAVAFFTSRVAEKLREYRLLAGELSVFVNTNRFKE